MKKQMFFFLILTVPYANAMTIDFDDVNVVGTHLDMPEDFYLSRGISFSPNFTVENVSIAESAFFPNFLAQGGTGVNALAITSAWNTAQSIDIIFTDLISTFETDVFDSEVGSILGSLVAFDSNGVELGNNTQITSSAMHGVITFSGPGISMIRITTDSDGALFDNLTFETLEVSEPSTFILFIVALLGLFSILNSESRYRRTGSPS